MWIATIFSNSRFIMNLNYEYRVWPRKLLIWAGAWGWQNVVCRSECSSIKAAFKVRHRVLAKWWGLGCSVRTFRRQRLERLSPLGILPFARVTLMLHNTGLSNRPSESAALSPLPPRVLKRSREFSGNVNPKHLHKRLWKSLCCCQRCKRW